MTTKAVLKVDEETKQQISHISKTLGKTKVQTMREIIKPLFETIEGLTIANMQVLKHPMRRILIIEVSGSQFFLEKKLRLKSE